MSNRIMDNTDFMSKMGEFHQSLMKLQGRYSVDTIPSTQQDAEILLMDLQISLEELRVAEEELRAQNEELMVTREAIEREAIRYRELFDFAPDAYLVTDSRGKILEANNAASELFGIPLEFLVKKPIIALVPNEDRRAFRGKLIDLPELRTKEYWETRIQPRNRLAVDVGITMAVAHDNRGNPAKIRWLIRDITMIKDTTDELQRLNDELEDRVAQRTAELVNANREKDDVILREQEVVIEAKSARRRFEIIAEVGDILLSSLSYQVILQNIADLSVSHVGNWCFIDVLEEDGNLYRVAMAANDPARERIGRRLLKDHAPGESNRNRLITTVMETGEMEMIEIVDTDLLATIAQDSKHLEILYALDPVSVMAVPMIARGKTIGVVSFVATRPSNSFTEQDGKLAIEIVRRAAQALDNARLYERSQLEIAERERAEEELRRSQAHVRRLVESDMIGVAAGRMDGTIVWANDKFLEILGFSREELDAGLFRWDTITPPEFRHADEKAIREIEERGASTPYEKEYVRRDGSRVSTLVGAVRSIDDEAEAVCYLIDITERVRAEEQLLRNLQQIDAIYQISNLVSHAESLEEIYTAAIEGLRRVLGVDRAAVLVSDSRGMMRFRRWEALSDSYRTALEGHSPWEPSETYHSPVLIADVQHDSSLGELRQAVLDEGIGSMAFIPLLYGGCLIGRFMISYNGAHEFSSHEIQVAQSIAGSVAVAVGRRQDKERLRVAYQKSNAILESITDAFLAFDLEWRVIYMNSQAREFSAMLYGKSPEELLGNNIWEVFPQIVGSDIYRLYHHAVETGEMASFEIYAAGSGNWFPNGQDIWFEVRVYPSPEGLSVYYHDISERKQIEIMEEELRTTSEESSRAKDRFLATLSHELRTPLTPVLAAAQELEEVSGALPVAVRSHGELIRRSVEMQVRLIDDLLDTTRIVNGKLRLKPEAVDLHELVRNVVQICMEESRKKGVAIDLDLGASQSFLMADPERLQQILWNLMRNGIRYTPRRGRVTLSTRNDEAGRLILDVIDTGVGIAQEDLGRIFSAFEQGEHSQGLGLGLAISRSLAELHGGILDAASNGEGKGTTFTLSLSSVAAPAHGGSEVPSEPLEAEERDRPHRILLVDDHADTRRVLQIMLEQHGYMVEACAGYASALDAAANGFDLLLSDIGLSDGSGLDLMRELKSRDKGIKGIALSGYGMADDVLRSREAGFETHLVKPIRSQQLCRAIEHTLNKPQMNTDKR